MSFLQYVKDKRYFFLFYLIIMLFVSLIMFVSGNREHAIGNVLYMNAGCLFFAAAYIVTGFYYRRTFYQELDALIGRHIEGRATALPEPQNAGQAMYLELLKKLHLDHAAQLHKLVQEKRDHQDFIMSWIHEVKLPIAASRLLMNNSTGKSVDYVVDKLEDELGVIDHYVEQALYYSRIDSFSKDYLITEIQLNTVVKESIKKAAKLFINKRIRFHMEDEPQFVFSDSKWLGYIVDQLVSNGVKYTNEGGAITVEFEDDSLEKRLIVQDTGIGIKPEDVHRVFDKGFTGTNGRSHAKSTGMGLYLARQMALKLGHDLSIQSGDGVYTRVTIHFPKIRTILSVIQD